MGTSSFNHATPVSQQHVYSGPQKTENGDSVVQLSPSQLERFFIILCLFAIYTTCTRPTRLEMSKMEIRVPESYGNRRKPPFSATMASAKAFPVRLFQLPVHLKNTQCHLFRNCHLLLSVSDFPVLFRSALRHLS